MEYIDMDIPQDILDAFKLIERYENAFVMPSKFQLAILGFTKVAELIIVESYRIYSQAGPWAEMLDSSNKINWI